MSDIIEKKSKMGKKGEIYTDKEIRKVVGLRPDDEIFLIARPGLLLIKKIPTLDQLLSKKPLAFVTIEEAEKISVESQKKSTLKTIEKLSK
ncbi:MAG: hypothetical protein ACTSYB_08160 [Candidatus Helarchaeota archaeon]